jgi:ADP-heptose:LPS heptosyltransferase
VKDYGQIPGGDNKLKPLLFPFHWIYPLKLWSKFRWWKNSTLPLILPNLNREKKWVTIVDRLGAPGDAIITANVIRCIKQKFPSLKINCITPHPELIKLDPSIDALNCIETFYSFDSTYWELIVGREKSENIVGHNLKRLLIDEFSYKAAFFLSLKEKSWADFSMPKFEKPTIAISTKSKEPVKNWPEKRWIKLIDKLKSNFSIIQLGDDSEPRLKQVTRLAGELSMRKSGAILSKVNLFIGPDSLLMHLANGLDIPSVIIFGGSRPVKCFGYAQNRNLATGPPCSPCWIHEGYATCQENLKCMELIPTDLVFSEVMKLYNQSQN